MRETLLRLFASFKLKKHVSCSTRLYYAVIFYLLHIKDITGLKKFGALIEIAKQYNNEPISAPSKALILKRFL